MATTRARLMTVAEFENIPEKGPFYFELHAGELVQMTHPIFDHQRAQRKLFLMLEALGSGGAAFTECSFRPLPEYELWVADVAYATQERWAAVSGQGHMLGASDLVVEVLSPSNTVSEITQKEQICLANGSQEFWVVDLKRKTVKVSTALGVTEIYKIGQRIPLYFAPDAELAVDSIFE